MQLVATNILTTNVRCASHAVAELPHVVASLKAQHVFIITGTSSAQKSGLLDRLTALLPTCSVTIHGGVSSHPSAADVQVVLNSIRSVQPDVVVGVGGGSSIDVAKVASVLIHSDEDITSILSSKEYPTKKVPIVAIPTLAGTGAEVTPFSVVYHEGKKFSLDAPQFAPDFAIIDPELAVGAPLSHSYYAGFDALSQAIEAFWAVRSTPESDAHAERAIRILPDALMKLVHDPTDVSVRHELALGSMYAGAAIAIARTTAPHALSYPFTIFGGVHHGAAVAMLLPYFIAYNHCVTEDDCVDPRGATYVRHKIETVSSFISDSVDGAVSRVEKLLTIGPDIVIPSLDVKEMLTGVNLDRLGNNPRALNEQTISDLYRYILNI